MATTVTQLHALFDSRCQDIITTDILRRWPYANRYLFYTEAQRRLIRKTGCLMGSVTATITAAAILANSGKITFAGTTPVGAALNKSDIYKVDAACWNGPQLTVITKAELYARSPDGTWRTEPGTPSHYNLDVFGEGSIFIYPIPAEDSSASGFRLDYTPSPEAFDADADVLSVADHWVYAVIDLALAIAHEQETDPDLIAKAEFYRGRYLEELSEVQSFMNRGLGQSYRTVPYPQF